MVGGARTGEIASSAAENLVLVLNVLTVCDVSFIDGRTGECKEIKSIFCTDGTAACAPGERMSIEVI